MAYIGRGTGTIKAANITADTITANGSVNTMQLSHHVLYILVVIPITTWGVSLLGPKNLVSFCEIPRLNFLLFNALFLHSNFKKNHHNNNTLVHNNKIQKIKKLSYY